MSTYTLAFVVSTFKNVSYLNQRIFAKPEAIREGFADYALFTGIEILRAMEIYLNINYTLKKIDQIAIPNEYFAPGAMENWGLVTYK